MSPQHPTVEGAMASTLDVLKTMTFYTLDDVLELFDRTAKDVNASAAGLHLSGRRDGAPIFGRVASQLWDLRRVIIAWRAGDAPSNFDLVLALEESLFAIEEFFVEFSPREARLQVPHRILTRMLLQLKPRAGYAPLPEESDARRA